MTEQVLRTAPMWVEVVAKMVPRLPMGRYRMTHWLRHSSKSTFLMHIANETSDYSFVCDLRDSISREVCFTGSYEPQETALVSSILKPDSVFVDVGANWGYFTLLAANLISDNGVVLSLEPDPRLFQILDSNIARNKFRHITALQVAAADKPGTLKLAGYEESEGNFGVSRIIADDEKHSSFYQVTIDALDNMLEKQNITKVDLMKMDIEGAEVFAIAGLKKHLKENRVKRLLLELHPAQLLKHGSSAAEIIETLQSYGYTPWTIDHSPAVTRRAAYAKSKNLSDIVRRYNPSDSLDAWAHQLWLAPGVELF